MISTDLLAMRELSRATALLEQGLVNEAERIVAEAAQKRAADPSPVHQNLITAFAEIACECKALEEAEAAKLQSPKTAKDFLIKVRKKRKEQEAKLFEALDVYYG